ncbi:MAG: tyrosine-type recombinase/integrase [Gammaproteobacteria bacterium]|nr:tyrosine-type recombinase/integrase [Pseudomonadales bacterium]
MPKVAKELKPLQVSRLLEPGWHAVGGVPGLLLQIREAASSRGQISRSWILRVRVGSVRQHIGLGPYPEVSLAAARQKARSIREDVRNGIDPLQHRKDIKARLVAERAKRKTFEECAEAYMDAHSSDYRNDKHRKQWASTLRTYAYPVIGSMVVADIAMHDVLNVLLQDTKKNGSIGQLWYTKTETAKRLLARIKTVLDYAAVRGFREGPNPALWMGNLSTQLPSPSGVQHHNHQPAVPYSQVYEFLQYLRRKDGITAKALEFLILTAVRSGNVRSALWSEISFTDMVWTIPAEKTKTRKLHRVPLSRQAIELLKSLPKIAGSDLVFPSPTNKPLTDMALSTLMRRMYESGELLAKAVPHGFRSSFRDWAAERTNYPDEIRKAASGHKVGDKVQEAYQRSDLLEKRRRLMQDWAEFVYTAPASAADNVVKIGLNQ